MHTLKITFFIWQRLYDFSFFLNKTKKFSKHRPSGPMLSKSRNVRISVCPSVCVSARLCPIFLEIRNSLGKSSEKKWPQIWTFLIENCQKSPRNKKFFFADFALQNMVETTLPEGLETSGRRAYHIFWHISRRFWVFAFWMIFSVFQKNQVLGYSWSARKPRFLMD